MNATAGPVLVSTRVAYGDALAERRARAVAAGRSPGPTAVVLTMGALHEGHGALMAAARQQVGPAGVVVVTVFVNPLQFGAGEDFERYPRTLADDVARCAAAGVDVVLAPDVAEVYGSPAGADPAAVTVDPGPLGAVLEGAARPGHFRGVLTVVTKLLLLARAEVAVFGEKDYQQLTLIRRLVRDLDLPVTVVGVPTVREPDGLARSSRNRYLDPAERAAAAAIPAALARGVAAAQAGGTAEAVQAAARAALAGRALLQPDYVAVTDPDLGPPPDRGAARLLVAVRVGSTRLIDNVALGLGGGGT